MSKELIVSEKALARLAKVVRIKAGKRKAEIALAMGVSRPTIYHAEESPERSLTQLRIRIIEAYSDVRAVGPLFRLEKKKREEL